MDNFRPLWTGFWSQTFSCAQPVDGKVPGRDRLTASRAVISTVPSPCCAQRWRRVCTGYPQACAQHGWTSAAAPARLSEPSDRTDSMAAAGSRGNAWQSGRWQRVSVAEIAPRGEEFERTPPHDIAAEQCVLGGMLLSKDAISDVLEVIRPRRPLPARAPARPRGHPRPLRPRRAADAVTVAAELTKRGELGPRRRRALPAHADRLGAHRGQRRLLRAHRARAGHPAPPGRGRHPHRAARLLRRRRTPTSWSTGPQAEVYGVTERRVSEDYLPLSEIMPGALDEIEAIGSRGGGHDRRAHRLRRPRRAHQRPAPGPDDRHRGPPRARQGAGAGHPAAHADRAGRPWARSPSATGCSARTAGR